MSRFERVQYTPYGMPLPWRPQPLWLLLGPVLGAGSGAVVGALLLVLTSGGQEVETMLWIGAWYGALLGGAVGLVAGLVMTFAVGSHLDAVAARDRATAAAALTTLVAMGLLTSPFLLYPFPFFSILVATLTATLAGALARWVAPHV